MKFHRSLNLAALSILSSSGLVTYTREGQNPNFPFDFKSHWHVPAAFGPDHTIHKEALVVAKPEEACTDIQNADKIKGKVVLVSRGTCSFASKIKRVQNLGAIGVIVADLYSTNDWTLIMSVSEEESTEITIPSIFISHSTALYLKSKLNHFSLESPKVSALRKARSLIKKVRRAAERIRERKNVSLSKFLKSWIEIVAKKKRRDEEDFEILVSIDKRGAIFPKTPKTYPNLGPLEAIALYAIGTLALLGISSICGLIGASVFTHFQIKQRERAIRKLPVIKYSKSFREKNRNFFVGDQDQCSVCLEDYDDHKKLVVLPCRHLFHESCVTPWLHRGGLCPVCKRNIFEWNSENCFHHTSFLGGFIPTFSEVLQAASSHIYIGLFCTVLVALALKWAF